MPFLLLSLSACDCYQNVAGIVVDAESKKPISEVEFVNLKKPVPDKMYKDVTDDKGIFEYSNVSGGLFKCPNVEMQFIKTGYENQIKIISSGTHQDTIFLKRKSD